MAEVQDSKATTMEIIRAGITQRYKPSSMPVPFAEAVYELFKEFSEDYKDEWERIDDNEEIYQGDHWKGVSSTLNDNNPNAPKPTTPIITSTIENLKADLSDEFPEAVITPDNADNEMAAKILTQVVGQELEACRFDREYDKHTQDVLNDGWSAWEVGYDPDANNGLGGSYIRYVVNKNFMCDPQVIDMQEGRAVFKFDRRPYDWFLQHYPDHVKYMSGDDDLVDKTHDDFNSTTAAKNKHCYRLIEAWFRVYDPATKKHKVHMALLAGHQVLDSSYYEKPEGYFKHGMYPFVITRLFPQKGSALGLGITDLFKDGQRFSDKLDQILLLNTFRASRPRLFIQDRMVDPDDARNFENEVVVVKGPADQVAQWQQANPLPSHIMSYIQIIRESIKTESGSNEQSRGGTTSGVTAASAISALQEMSTKRSRMEARQLHYGFEDAIRMLLEVLREFAIVQRDITVTSKGKRVVMPFSNKSMRTLLEGKNEIPISFHVSVRTTRQTKYSKMQHNELWLQMMNALSGSVDPAIMIEGLEYDEKERLLENITAAQSGGMMNLQMQCSELTQLVRQQTEELNAYKKAIAQAQNFIMQNQNMQMQQGMNNMQYDRAAEAAQGAIPQDPRYNPSELAQAM